MLSVQFWRNAAFAFCPFGEHRAKPAGNECAVRCIKQNVLVASVVFQKVGKGELRLVLQHILQVVVGQPAHERHIFVEEGKRMARKLLKRQSWLFGQIKFQFNAFCSGERIHDVLFAFEHFVKRLARHAGLRA